jgi:hypothetical protein
MTRNRWSITLFAAASLCLPLPACPQAETWIAWVSDEACGAKHSEPGQADCIRKCNRGGASVGHPEWKPQPLVLVKESDHSVWTVDNPSSLNGFEGQRVRADVEINSNKQNKNGLHVKKVAAASERNP